MHTIQLAALVAEVVHRERLTEAAAARQTAVARLNDPQQRVLSVLAAIGDVRRPGLPRLFRTSQGSRSKTPPSRPSLQS